MPESTPAEAVQEQQRKDASRLMERLSQVSVPDLTVSYTLEKSATVLPGLLVRFIVVAVLFRLNSGKKWRLALEQELLPEGVQRWLGIGELAELIEKATVDWSPPQVLMDTVSWQVIECLTRCGVPQPIAVVRQTIRELLLRGSKVSQNGIVLDRRFWRTFWARSARPCSAEVAEECRQRIEFVLGQVDLAQEIERRWLDVPELSGPDRAKLEAVRVAQSCERWQALEEGRCPCLIVRNNNRVPLPTCWQCLNKDKAITLLTSKQCHTTIPSTKRHHRPNGL